MARVFEVLFCEQPGGVKTLLLSQGLCLSFLKTCKSSPCTCFIPWDYVAVWHLDSHLLVYLCLIAVLQCLYLQKPVLFLSPEKHKTTGDLHIHEMKCCTVAKRAFFLRCQNGYAKEVFCSVQASVANILNIWNSSTQNAIICLMEMKIEQPWVWYCAVLMQRALLPLLRGWSRVHRAGN